MANTPLEELCNNAHAADSFRQDLKQYEAQQKRAEDLSKFAQEITTQQVDYSNVPAEARLEAVKRLQAIAQARAAAYVKGNLDDILQSTPKDKLARALCFAFKPESNNQKELAELLAQYQLIYAYESAQNLEEKRELGQRIDHALLKTAVESRIRGKVPDSELEAVTSIILLTAPHDPMYLHGDKNNGVIEEGMQYVKKTIEEYDRQKIKDYLAEKQVPSDDGACARFASAMGA